MKKLPPLNNSKSKEKDRDTSKDKSLKASTKNMKFRSQKRI